MGNVGAGVFKHLTQNRALLRERLGYELDVQKIALRDPGKDRGVAVPPELVTTRWEDLLEDPAIQIIVELMGQKDESLRLMLGAIEWFRATLAADLPGSEILTPTPGVALGL